MASLCSRNTYQVRKIKKKLETVLPIILIIGPMAKPKL